METVLETHGLTRAFGAQEAVCDLDLALGGGKVLAFLGLLSEEIVGRIDAPFRIEPQSK
jgi:hypothetical protein